MINTPFTKNQVEGLNRFQEAGYMHPFTCKEDSCRGVLMATIRGWVCTNCSPGIVQQNWAHEFMVIDEELDLQTFLDNKFNE